MSQKIPGECKTHFKYKISNWTKSSCQSGSFTKSYLLLTPLGNTTVSKSVCPRYLHQGSASRAVLQKEVMEPVEGGASSGH